MSEGGQIAEKRDSSKYYVRAQSPLNSCDGDPAGLGEKNLLFKSILDSLPIREFSQF